MSYLNGYNGIATSSRRRSNRFGDECVAPTSDNKLSIHEPSRALTGSQSCCNAGLKTIVLFIRKAIMMIKFLQAFSITALLFAIKRLVVRKPPSRPYRLPKDEWSKIRGYKRPS